MKKRLQKMDSVDLNLLKLYGINKGYLSYLPLSISAVRDAKALLEDIFESARVYSVIRGQDCLSYEQLQRGLRRRVLKRLDSTCVACNTHVSVGIHLHHIKPHWRTWNNVFGFTLLCKDCHDRVHSGNQFWGYSQNLQPEEAREMCRKIELPSTTEYDPPPLATEPESTIVKVETGYYSMGALT